MAENTCADLDIHWEWYNPPPLYLAGFKRALKDAWRNQIGDKCQRCRQKMRFRNVHSNRTPRDYATIDHILPKSRGGSDVLENPQVICARCNGRKADRLAPPRTL